MPHCAFGAEARIHTIGHETFAINIQFLVVVHTPHTSISPFPPRVPSRQLAGREVEDRENHSRVNIIRHFETEN